MDGVYPGCLRQDVYVELCSLILEGVFILKQSAGRVHERCQKKHATQIKRKIMMPKAARLQPSNSGGLRGAGRNRLLLGLGCSPSHQPSWLCRRRTCCVASSMSVSSFCQLYCSPEPCSCEPRLWLQESDGDWLQTQVTAEVTVSDYRKTAKSFFMRFMDHVLFLCRLKFPKSWCPWCFIPLQYLCCRKDEEGTVWFFVNPLTFSVRDSLKKLVPWATGIVCYLLPCHLFVGSTSTHTPAGASLIPGVQWSPRTVLSIFSDQAHLELLSRVVSALPLHAWIKESKYRWEMGFLFYHML